ncbi:MAG: hypothetical protein R2747_03280 [Pyrinomonadaceae bacterium]
MQTQKYFRIASLSLFFFLFIFASPNFAQPKEVKPELSVVGVELGNRETAKKYLLPGHHPRAEEDGRASYYFYNEWGTQVMRLTVPSVDDPYFINEIEVFSVGKSYQKRHYQDAEHGLMMTENGIFIGFRQTAMNLFVGIRNVGKKNQIGPEALIDIKGEPTEREETGEKGEVLIYEIDNVKVADSETPGKYTGRYEFYKGKLKRFSLKIDLEKNSKPVN